VAKDSTKKTKSAKAKPAKKAGAKKPGIKNLAKVAKVRKVVKKVANNPMTTEVVAATLVAAAAALRNPKKAQALALEAGDDLKKAATSGMRGSALWQLALDIARKSIDEIDKEGGATKKAAKAKKATTKK
jgi:hypothetical protein